MKETPLTTKINNWLVWLAKRHDVSLAIVFVCAIFMMILPLPTPLVDVLLSINLSVSLLLLMIAIYLKSPAEFSAFPSVLLVTTLYRLSLTVSTSRLILLQHDAGEIITAFGKFVVGGNLVVGAIIFCIITIVQFIVITKGSERVAEVSARFSLDAMPGKQMSIDGDMRAGTIDADEAKRLRNLVQQESQLYGAMDGAMKFVKGDAMASIIVIVVNILGGITVGVLQHGMSMGEAASTYTVLSIGDGLVSQIPALIISITSGIIVTRVPGGDDENLGAELFGQLGKNHGALLTAAAIVGMFALIPGFPAWAFLSLAAIFGGIGYWLKMRHQDKPLSKVARAVGEKQLGAIPLAVSFPNIWSETKIKTIFKTFRDNAFEQFGLPLPEIQIISAFDKRLRNDKLFTLYLYQEPICQFEPSNERCLCVCLEDNSTINGDVAKFTLSGENLFWVATGEISKEDARFEIFEKEEMAHYALKRLLTLHAKEFLGMQESRYLMEGMEGRYSELVRELQRQVPLSRLTDVLQRLIEEQISIRDLRGIFEALVVWNNKEKDIVLLTEYIRIALKRHIMALVTYPDGKIRMWHIGEALENLIRESIRQTSAGSYSALEPEQSLQIVELIRAAIQNHRPAYLLTTVDVRRYLKKLIEIDLPGVQVFSKQEIGDDRETEILGNIEWVGDHVE